MLPIHRKSDIPPFTRRAEHDLALLILSRIGSAAPELPFIYQGGSDPGSSRQVLPVLFFMKFEMAYDLPGRPEIYLLALCLTRRQARTFRLDRISPL